MTSNRLILLFLGIIFLVVVILSSNKIAGALRGWFGKYIPAQLRLANISASATPTPTLTPKPTVTLTIAPKGETKQSPFTGSKSTPSTQIPATGPDSIAWIIIGTAATGGIILRRLQQG